MYLYSYTSIIKTYGISITVGIIVHEWGTYTVCKTTKLFTCTCMCIRKDKPLSSSLGLTSFQFSLQVIKISFQHKSNIHFQFNNYTTYVFLILRLNCITRTHYMSFSLLKLKCRVKPWNLYVQFLIPDVDRKLTTSSQKRHAGKKRKQNMGRETIIVSSGQFPME